LAGARRPDSGPVGHEPGGALEPPGRGSGLDVSRLDAVPDLAAGTATRTGTEAGKAGHCGSNGRQERPVCRGAPGPVVT